MNSAINFVGLEYFSLNACVNVFALFWSKIPALLALLTPFENELFILLRTFAKVVGFAQDAWTVGLIETWRSFSDWILAGRSWFLSNCWVFNTFSIFKGQLEGICESSLNPFEKFIELFDIFCLLNCGQNLFPYCWWFPFSIQITHRWWIKRLNFKQLNLNCI